jgi:hypothetical protein
MINANNINGAISALGGNVDTDNNIINLVTRKVKNQIVKVHTKINGLDELELGKKEKDRRLEN